MQGSNLKSFFVGAFVVASGLSVLAAVNLTAFTPGTPIKSADVNANFSTLKAAVEGLQAGTGLADGAVTRAKLAIGGTAADGKVLKLSGGNLVWGDDLTGGGGGAAYSAGAGLVLSGTTFSVSFAGSGSSSTAAKSDHDHFGSSWSGSGVTGLKVGTASTAPESFGLVGVSGGSDPGAGIGSGRPRAGVLGVALPGPNGRAGVYGEARDGIGIYGRADGSGAGVYGHNNTSGTYGSLGNASAGVVAGGQVALEVRGAIKVSGSSPAAFTHRTTAGNITANFTTIDNPLTNGQPSAMLIVTHNYNPPGAPGTYHNYAVGVFYNEGKWHIYNENETVNMPAERYFNVLVIHQ